ncbi:hypothetical protein [Capnocytophaga cynodegmi]|nr:hypothetical protein [Capnocytophaga cynodegmi]
MGRAYEGFVIGKGYAWVEFQAIYSQDYILTPKHYISGTEATEGTIFNVQHLDSSAECVSLSLGYELSNSYPVESPPYDSHYEGEKWWTSDQEYLFVGNNRGGWNCYRKGDMSKSIFEVLSEVVVSPESSQYPLLEDSMFSLNVGINSISTYYIYGARYYKWNNVWHKTKTRGISNRFQSRWNNNGAKSWRNKQVKTVQKAIDRSKKVTKAGWVLLGADMIMSGEARASHYISGGMLALSSTGIGSIIAGAWFLVDMGTGAYNYFVNDEFETLSDMIDNSVGTIEVYEGLY